VLRQLPCCEAPRSSRTGLEDERSNPLASAILKHSNKEPRSLLHLDHSISAPPLEAASKQTAKTVATRRSAVATKKHLRPCKSSSRAAEPIAGDTGSNVARNRAPTAATAAAAAASSAHEQQQRSTQWIRPRGYTRSGEPAARCCWIGATSLTWWGLVCWGTAAGCGRCCPLLCCSFIKEWKAWLAMQPT